ncbi:hypothetical protein ACFQ1S_11835 [Kibdelosporangium lantanae]|uniref:HTH-type transcriptional repressor KstR2 C-terminal domain-containing protein n=1 Tax=Kibdelosporangium lantanae TaxID=1497396 RepID=A0ABW3M6E2_9PSEU
MPQLRIAAAQVNARVGDLAGNADLVVDYFFGAIHHLGVWYRRGGSLSPADMATHYTKLLISSLEKENR